MYFNFGTKYTGHMCIDPERCDKKQQIKDGAK